MELKSIINRKNVVTIGIWLMIAILFGLSYTQSPLYEGNQNTKFLHGLARAGAGYLQEDWLANTVDPLPVFSFLVYVTAIINEKLFYVYYILLFGVYVYSLFGIISVLYNFENSRSKQITFLTLIFAVHSRWLLWYIQKRVGVDLEFLHSGVAAQYLLGLEFQNSTFGVLLLLSICVFLRKKYFWAMFWLSLASIFHSAYLFSAALITIAYMLIVFMENIGSSGVFANTSLKTLVKNAKKPINMGLLALVLVLPVIWYSRVYLGPTTPELWREYLQILVHDRIPHHSLPQVWLNPTAYIQIAIVMIGLFLAGKTRLSPIMLSLSLGGFVFTIIQIISGSNSIATLAPWRVSILLVPLSTHLVIGFFISKVVDLLKMEKSAFQLLIIAAALIALFVFVKGGTNRQKTYGISFREGRVRQMMDFVKETKKSGELYMIPPKEPDLNNFRLYTGAPTFVNWKSHPYKDTDFLEWYDRVQTALGFYDTHYLDEAAACEMLIEISLNYGITHVVIKRRDAQLGCDFVIETYREQKFTVFAINP